MRRSRTPQRLRELRAEVSVRTAAAARTVCKTGRSLAAQVRNCNREQIRCVEVDADGVERARTFTLHKQIGEGSYSTVLKVCEWQPDGRPQVYAMKRILAQDAAARRRVAGEVELMLQLPPHPNILGLVAYSSAETGAGGILAQLVLEMCYHGSVVHYLLERGGEPFSLPQVYRLFLDMASGLLHLHAQSPPIAHRDFKLENVLLAPDGFAKLCDFGSATCRSGAYAGKAAIDSAEDELHRLSTAQYRPPESFDLHRGQPLSEKADVWALGVAFFKLACNKDPAPPGEERLGALNAAWRQRLPEPGARGSLGRHRAPDGVSRELLELALQQDPARRPSVRELLQWLRAQAPPGLPSVSSVGLLYAPGVLTVRLGGARDLLSKGGVGGEPLCYARVSCEGAVRQTADAPWPHPVWRARFSFRAHSLSKVLVAVWQRQPGGVADEFLGQLSVSLSRQAQLLAAAGTAGADEGPGWRALQRRSDRSRVQGSAQVLLEFAPGRAEREGWEAWSDAIDGGNGGAARAPSARWAERGADGGSSTLAGGGASASSLAEGGSSSSSGAQELIDFGEQQHDRQRAPQRGRPPLAADHSVGQALSAPPPSALDREAGGPADPFGLAALEREGSSERDLIAWEVRTAPSPLHARAPRCCGWPAPRLAQLHAPIRARPRALLPRAGDGVGWSARAAAVAAAAAVARVTA